jgi:hypothetical protein
MTSLLHAILLSANALTFYGLRTLLAAKSTGRLILGGQLLAERDKDPSSFRIFSGCGVAVVGLLVAGSIWLVVGATLLRS